MMMHARFQSILTPTSPALVRFGGVMALLILVFDQLSKWWVLSILLPCQVGEQGPGCIANSPFYEITDFFNLVLVWNFGISFGLFAHEAMLSRVLLIIVALAISCFLVVWLWHAAHWTSALAIGAVLGGAIGNVVDRVRFGAVADFLDFHAFGWHWPAFNVADSCIVLGVTFLLAESLFQRDEAR